MPLRLKRLSLRLTAEDIEEIQKKSQGYQSMSAMIRHAVHCLDNETVTARRERIEALTAFYKSFDARLALAGSNLNQLAKRTHEATHQGALPPAYFTEVLMPQLEEMQQDFAVIKSELLKLSMQAMRS